MNKEILNEYWMEWRMKREAVLYEKLENQKIKCNVCARRCIITEGNKGNSKTRINELLEIK